MSSTPDPPDASSREGATADTSVDGDPMPVLAIGADGTVCRASAAALDLLGRDEDDVVNRHLSRLELTRGSVRALLGRSSEGEDLRDEEIELRRPNGERLVAAVTASAPQPGADPWRVHWLLRDVTDERDAEERDGRLAAIIHDSDDAIISKRIDGVITSWNPAAERLFGYTAAEIVGQPISVIMPADMDGEFPGIMRRLALGEHIDHYETVRRTRSGRLIDVSVSIAPIRNGAGRIIGASDITRDITERRALERKQREFLTMVAHDLRSPLTSIKGFAQLMQRRETYSSTGIAAVLNQVRHIERLVEDVLEITRLDEDRQEMSFSPVDLVALTRMVVDRARLLQGTDRIALAAPDDALIGTWDAQRMEQVLDNVLSNAVKYAPTGTIEVALTANDAVEVAVRDHGAGIAPEHLPHVFERFYRVPGEHAAGRGVGLGLTIARTLVEAHGGRIAVDSQPGQGTEVTITLPWDSSTYARSA